MSEVIKAWQIIVRQYVLHGIEKGDLFVETLNTDKKAFWRWLGRSYIKNGDLDAPFLVREIGDHLEASRSPARPSRPAPVSPVFFPERARFRPEFARQDHPPVPPPALLRTLLDGKGVEHRQVVGAGDVYRPVTHFGNIPVSRTTISGVPDLSPAIGPTVPERDGPFGGPALGPGGQPLFGPRRPPGASPFA